MKDKLFLLLGAVAAFASSSIVLYKLLDLYPRISVQSFRELYEDNAVDLNL